MLNEVLKITLSHFLRTETTNEVISTSNCPGFILYALFILFYATRTRLCDYMKHVFWAKHFTPITVCKGVGVLIPHKRSFFKENSASRYFFFHIAFPNSSFVSINKKQTNKQGTLYSLVWKVTKLNTRPVDSHLRLKRVISRIHSIQAKTSRTLYLNFGESRFQGSFTILFPVKKFCVFPNPENTLQDLV